jgi:formylglycine-generating enzyme required for sulfatase activity
VAPTLAPAPAAPRGPDAWLDEGAALLRQGRSNDALERFERAMEQFRGSGSPPDPRLRDRLIEAHKALALARVAAVPGGEFQRGTAGSSPDASPPHRVTLRPFRIDRHEVSNQEYQLCVLAGACSAAERYSWSGQPKAPVTGVSWYDADAYCRWLGKRLPTEAEWEFAARGGQPGHAYPWGDVIAAGDANFGNRLRGPRTIGSYRPNGYGLFDMAGNVSEWCQDWYRPDYYKSLARVGTAIANPPGPGPGTYKVKRGGSWKQYEPDLRVGSRSFMTPSSRDEGLGFRCAADR